MADTDLIARIYPVLNNEAGDQFLKQNPERLLPALRLPGAPVAALDRGERVSTQPLDDSLRNVDDYLDCLELRFSNPPRTGRGFVFGRDEKCDIVLPANLTNISSYHFSLTFESDFEDTDMYRLVLRDLGSRSGTSVEYNGKGGSPRRYFRWILSGHSETLNTPIIIGPHHMLMLRIEVFVPRISGHFDDCVRHLLRQRPPESWFDDLSLDNPPHTEAATGIQSPDSGPILIDTAEFGRGAFAVVYRCWNVSTGRLFARKQSRNPLSNRDRAAWRREARLLARLSHENIVRIIELIEAPDDTIELHLEPIFGGTLRRRLPLPYPQGLDVIRQCLSALAYLHGQSTPIVHRDIKPDNILVDGDPQGTAIRIKLADFGFSREDRSLKTPLGTPLYSAPEICEGARQWDYGCQDGRYSPAVDIWSLGVVAAQCLHNLPSSTACGLDWCEEMVKHILTTANRQANPDLYRVLLSHMVVINPSRRASAQQCHDQVVSLLSVDENPVAAESPDRTEQTPSPGSSRPFHESDEDRPRYGSKRLPAGFYPPDSSTTPPRGHYGVKRLPATLRPATILPTTESDDGTATTTAASPPSDPGTPSRAASRRRQHPHRATPYPPPAPHHRNPASQQSSTSSTAATITPRRITRSITHAARAARASNTTATSTATRFSEPRVSDLAKEDDDPRPSPSEPERAESSYLAAGYVLNPLWFGSELVSEVGRVVVGGEGEEVVALSSVATTAAGASSGMQSSSVVQAPQRERERGGSSVVVLTDDWLFLPGEDAGNGV